MTIDSIMFRLTPDFNEVNTKVGKILLQKGFTMRTEGKEVWLIISRPSAKPLWFQACVFFYFAAWMIFVMIYYASYLRLAHAAHQTIL